jgi:hypothetical protein
MHKTHIKAFTLARTSASRLRGEGERANLGIASTADTDPTMAPSAKTFAVKLAPIDSGGNLQCHWASQAKSISNGATHRAKRRRGDRPCWRPHSVIRVRVFIVV